MSFENGGVSTDISQNTIDKQSVIDDHLDGNMI